jgi:hypothetical protein
MPKLNRDDVRAITTYHPPTPRAAELHVQVRTTIRVTMENLNEILPDSRELSLVNTKLEEAMFWANEAIARNHDQL